MKNNNEVICKKIGEKVKRLRHLHGLSKEALSNEIGNRSTNALSRVEAGNSVMNMRTLISLANYFNVDFDTLINPNKELKIKIIVE